MEILIKNARLVDGDIDMKGDIYIKEGYIEEIGEDLEYNCNVIDGSQLCVMPSFIDVHVHFRDPGAIYKEDLETGSKSALRGGHTYVNLMYDSKDDWSITETLDYIYNKNEKLDLIDINQSIFIGRHEDEDTINILQTLDSRIKVIIVERSGFIKNSIFLKVMDICKDKNILLIVQAEDKELSGHESRFSEELETIRCCLLAKHKQSNIHFTHVSCKEAIKAIKELKSYGGNITCDITPHHLILNDITYKVNPPLKEKEDTNVFIDSIKDGTIDIIATDHAPQSQKDMNEGLTGAIGIETSFSVCYTELVEKHKVEIRKLSSLMSGKASEILNLNQGYLRKGYKGDIVLVDLNRTGMIDSSKLQSKSNNTPFEKHQYSSKVLMTIRNGEIKYSDESM